MGVHFGTSYFSVIAEKLEDCLISQADHYPSLESDHISYPNIDERYKQMGTIELFKTEQEARDHLRLHIYKETRYEIPSVLQLIEGYKLDIQSLKYELRMLEKKTDKDQQSIDSLNKSIEFYETLVKQEKAKLAELRQARKRKLSITFL